jgi:hypothetical protein
VQVITEQQLEELLRGATLRTDEAPEPAAAGAGTDEPREPATDRVAADDRVADSTDG